MWPWVLCLFLSLALAIYSCVTPVEDSPKAVVVLEKPSSTEGVSKRLRMRKPQETYDVDAKVVSANAISSESST